MDYFDDEFEPTLDAFGDPLNEDQVDEKLLCELSLLEFTKRSWEMVVDQPLIVEPHIELQCSHLEAISCSPRYSPRHSEQSISRLLANIPPAVGKSTILSVIWPMWVWTWWPSARFMFFSYAEKIIKRDSPLCRLLFKSEWYQRYWGRESSPGERDQVLEFDNISMGWRMSLLVGQGTGHHPDFILIDDPQSREGSKNPNGRERVKKWYFETLPSRGKTRRAAHVVQQQRLDEDDLSGEVLNFIATNKGKRVADQWHHLCLPMHFNPDRAMQDRGFGGDWRKVPGELLCPKLLDDEAVEDLVLEVTQTDPGGADAQLEQDPKKYAGDIFKVDRLIRLQKHEVKGIKFDAIVRFWDRAATQDGGCNTAGVKMARRGEDLFILHCAAGQWSSTNVYTQLNACAIVDSMEHGVEHFEIVVEEEQGAGGKEAAENVVRNMPLYRVSTERPWTNKDARAQPFANRMALCNVYIVEDDDWTAAYIEELRKFPGGKFKDRVDASSGAYYKLFGTGVPKRKAIMSGLRGKNRCNGGCKRPAAKDSEYCCAACEQVAAFNDPTMIVEHDAECAQRNFDDQQKRQ